MQGQNDIDSLIIRRLTGDMSEAEQREFDVRLEHDAILQTAFEDLSNVWQKTGDAKALQHFEQQRDASWAKAKARIENKQNRKSSFTRRLMRVAAVLVPLFVVGTAVWLSFFNRTHEFEYTAMNVDTITLPDNTELILNAGSRIQYFDRAGERRLRLHGMAHLHVARDEQHPFIVKAGDVKVRVLGTVFNVENVAGRERIKVDVESGKVRVMSKKGQVDLIANQSIIVENGKIDKEELAADNSWVEGKLVLDNASIEETAAKLMNYYPEIQKLVFNGKPDTTRVTTQFECQSLDEVLEELNIHFSRKITLREGNLVISD